MVPPYSNRISRVPPYSRTLGFLLIQDYHLLWSTFPSRSNYFPKATGLVRVRSSLLTESHIDVLSSSYLDISVRWVCFTFVIPDKSGGFPHSEIFGSRLIRSSPKLIAAYYVFHRLLAPRHPPNALFIFIY